MHEGPASLWPLVGASCCFIMWQKASGHDRKRRLSSRHSRHPRVACRPHTRTLEPSSQHINLGNTCNHSMRHAHLHHAPREPQQVLLVTHQAELHQECGAREGEAEGNHRWRPSRSTQLVCQKNNVPLMFKAPCSTGSS